MHSLPHATELDFYETNCYWRGCGLEFETQDELVQASIITFSSNTVLQCVSKNITTLIVNNFYTLEPAHCMLKLLTYKCMYSF